uniref:Uncharacterized protein n=1 Tax=Anguilla anguilla TaxID=7936 RepID=A0A0E9UP14_ANGAN
MLGEGVHFGIHPVNRWLIMSKVMPLGHTMLSVTSGVRSAPFSPPFSILAGCPSQSST